MLKKRGCIEKIVTVQPHVNLGIKTLMKANFHRVFLTESRKAELLPVIVTLSTERGILLWQKKEL